MVTNLEATVNSFTNVSPVFGAVPIVNSRGIEKSQVVGVDVVHVYTRLFPIKLPRGHAKDKVSGIVTSSSTNHGKHFSWLNIVTHCVNTKQQRS